MVHTVAARSAHEPGILNRVNREVQVAVYVAFHGLFIGGVASTSGQSELGRDLVTGLKKRCVAVCVRTLKPMAFPRLPQLWPAGKTGGIHRVEIKTLVGLAESQCLQDSREGTGIVLPAPRYVA